VLVPKNANEGRAIGYSYRYAILERAILCKLAELKPGDVFGKEIRTNKPALIAAELEELEAGIADLKARQMRKYSPSNAETLAAMDERKSDLTAKLSEAQAEESSPVREAWEEAQSLMTALDEQPDPIAARLKLRSALARIIERIWILPLRVGKTALCTVQVHFRGKPESYRTYFVQFRPAQAGFAVKPGRWYVWSRRIAPHEGTDLRTPEGAQKREKLMPFETLHDGVDISGPEFHSEEWAG
jgi:hypothetical protein